MENGESSYQPRGSETGKDKGLADASIIPQRVRPGPGYGQACTVSLHSKEGTVVSSSPGVCEKAVLPVEDAQASCHQMI